jgi:ubiquitin-conjugating enzyme E2 N
LLSAPNLDDPLDEEVAAHWRSDIEGAKKVAREWTLKYAQEF